MLEALALVLAVAAYAAFYLGAPGRQSRPVGPPRPMRWGGAALTVAALAVSVAATGSAVGPAMVLTVMMTAASALAVAGPFLLPEAEGARPRAPRPAPGGVAPARPPKRPPTCPPSAP